MEQLCGVQTLFMKQSKRKYFAHFWGLKRIKCLWSWRLMAAVTDLIPAHPPPWLCLYQQSAGLGRSRYVKWLGCCQTLPFTLCMFGGLYWVWCHGMNAQSAEEHKVCSSSAPTVEQSQPGQVLWWEPEPCKWAQGRTFMSKPSSMSEWKGWHRLILLVPNRWYRGLPSVMFACTSPSSVLPRVRRSLCPGMTIQWHEGYLWLGVPLSCLPET